MGTPSCWRGHQACVRRGDNHANNITQKARTLLTEDADPAFCDAYFPGSCMLRQHPAGRVWDLAGTSHVGGWQIAGVAVWHWRSLLCSVALRSRRAGRPSNGLDAAACPRLSRPAVMVRVVVYA